MNETIGKQELIRGIASKDVKTLGFWSLAAQNRKLIAKQQQTVDCLIQLSCGFFDILVLWTYTSVML